MATASEIRNAVIQRLLTDEDYFALFLQNPAAALAQFPDLNSRDARLIKRDVTDQATLEAFAQRLNISVRGMVANGGSKSIIMPSEPSKKEESAEEEEGTPQRIVSTGFAEERQPDKALTSETPLLPNTKHYFWFEVGDPATNSIEVTPTPLPDDLPPKAKLQVVLYDFKKGVQLLRPNDVGVVELQEDGTIKVVQPVAEPNNLDDPSWLQRRLFFPIRTEVEHGRFQLRCNIYYQQNLLQSRLITFYVQTTPRRMRNALQSELDYVLSQSFNGRTLQNMGDTKLSIMLNDNGNGTHGFRFFGAEEFKNDAELDAGALSNLIEMARGALRKAAWGDEEPYKAGKTYRYTGGLNEDRLRGDLITMALRGYRFYTTLIGRLAGSTDNAWELADMMLTPGQVQIASKQSARLVIPAAMIYDYPLDDGLPSSKFSICDTFLQALKQETPLEETVCFQGQCPQHGEDTVVCPSGFWGFRHSLGLPVTIQEAPDAPSIIQLDGEVTLAVTVSTDPNFKERPSHEKRLQAMGFDWQYADNRDDSLTMLKKVKSEVVYFYCHGGMQNDLPYLSVGERGSARFTSANLFNKRIRWRQIRPLVFINGCFTTQLSPERAMDLVTAFVATSHAAGVVGTEISIFEPIATSFAEECFRRFLIEKQTLGVAIRGARLKMLKEGNPLGLVYIPYAMAGLHLQ